jgi:hypothetical protein
MNSKQEKIFCKFKKDNCKTYKEFNFYEFNDYIAIFASTLPQKEGKEIARIYPDGTLREI